MGIVYSLILIACMILSFWAGKSISDRYHDREEINIRYALEKQFVRLRAGVDADDPAKPYVAKPVVDQVFMDRLRKSGKAVKRVG